MIRVRVGFRVGMRVEEKAASAWAPPLPFSANGVGENEWTKRPKSDMWPLAQRRKMKG